MVNISGSPMSDGPEWKTPWAMVVPVSGSPMSEQWAYEWNAPRAMVPESGRWKSLMWMMVIERQYWNWELSEFRRKNRSKVERDQRWTNYQSVTMTSTPIKTKLKSKTINNTFHLQTLRVFTNNRLAYAYTLSQKFLRTVRWYRVNQSINWSLYSAP